MRSIFMRYPEGRAKAVTFSYDDGKEQDRRLSSLFNKYGMKATFNLNGMQLRLNDFTKADIQEIYLSKGHEIAIHGLNHRANGNPDSKKIWVVNLISVCAVNEALIRLYVIVYFNIRGVPYLVVARKLLTNRLNMLPVVVSVKLVAVSPDIKKPRYSSCVVRFSRYIEI